jgi:L-serine dehydratase
MGRRSGIYRKRAMKLFAITPRIAPAPPAPAPELSGVGDLFKIGIGPSSSHTIGPMKAAGNFRASLTPEIMNETDSLVATVFGSLAWTGRGHSTDKAILLGLAGASPESIDPEYAESLSHQIRQEQSITLPNGRLVAFDAERDIVFDRVHTFPRHPNAMTFEAFDARGRRLHDELWFSIGGGFVVRDGGPEGSESAGESLPYDYESARELLEFGRHSGLSISAMALANEQARRGGSEVYALIDRLAEVMLDCIERGLSQEGELPGGLRTKRRAKSIYDQVKAQRARNEFLATEVMESVSAFAMAVNEENAAGGRVVTAPTNGAAGVVPAVLRYYKDFCSGYSQAGVREFFLTATAIGALIRRNASISGAEVGCQGEVGSAAAMAAAGLTAALGGTNEQIENAAEIAIEHHLGMTCDPIGGLVQIPCIERNAFGAIKAINAAALSLRGDGTHRVSLDQVIETMRQTGMDMQSKYKETSRGGLAVNVPEC